MVAICRLAKPYRLGNPVVRQRAELSAVRVDRWVHL